MPRHWISKAQNSKNARRTSEQRFSRVVVVIPKRRKRRGDDSRTRTTHYRCSNGLMVVPGRVCLHWRARLLVVRLRCRATDRTPCRVRRRRSRSAAAATNTTIILYLYEHLTFTISYMVHHLYVSSSIVVRRLFGLRRFGFSRG